MIIMDSDGIFCPTSPAVSVNGVLAFKEDSHWSQTDGWDIEWQRK